jgi:mannosyltransferase OCH1-like enzyme
MEVSAYTASTHVKSTTDIINAGTCNDNVKIIKLSKKYNNPKFYPRAFKQWPDTFSVTIVDDEHIQVRRTDVTVGGWGETLLIDVAHENNNISSPLSPQKIPRVLYQTFETTDVPEGMFFAIKSWTSANPEYEHCFYTENDRASFIQQYFGNSVLDAYLRLLPGAFKADLWRCCILYEKGGVYVDTDMVCLRALNELIEDDDTFITCRDDPMSFKFLANGFIASTPRHPFLKKQIDNIVNNVHQLANRYYLDISGPGLLGKSVNELCGRDEHGEFALGINNLNGYIIKILQHNWVDKCFSYNDIPILITEYPNKTNDMNMIGNQSFYSMVQAGMVYRSIPSDLYYTSYDHVGVNTYMVDSFTEKNQWWKIHHYTDIECLQFFKEHNDELIELLGVDVLNYYLTLHNGGEKSDLWRYCVLYLKGGVYTDTDTYCNVPLDNWVKHHDLILGIEAFLSIDVAKTFGADTIGFQFNDTIISVCNWTMACKSKHEFFKNLIIDICQNPIVNNVLVNTGPGRLSKHVAEYFTGTDFSQLEYNNIEKGKSILLSINKFGSNQTHSNSSKNFDNPFAPIASDVYITHMFDGSWRTVQNKEIKIFNSTLGISHNLTLLKTTVGFTGVARLDKDTSRTHFMQHIGDCRSLVEYQFDETFTLIDESEKLIGGYESIAKFEDYRFFTFNGNTYLSVSYIDENFNTRVAILDEHYKFLGDVQIDNYNAVSWVGEIKTWEKNWLFFEKDEQLFFIYSTTPNYIVYKCLNFETLEFIKYIDIAWPLTDNVPEQEHYFTSYIGSTIKVATGGSSNPILIKDSNVYLYFIHTKLYNQQKYNHYAVILDLELNPIKLVKEPIITKFVPYPLLFVSSVLETDNYLVFTGGVQDSKNFIWELSKSQLFKLIGI